ncbi:iron-sulfur cluster co-chaperone protein HscB, mitochondrial [Rhizoctonia solani]|uniref:Iron-sulfur cluster co-chaperone protein HscB, mitochondrial n=1 Tax=Rhizoctonia solani TaxID=456999 RepID=A0A8H8NVB4_9AGAM|nr:iron-sulfur cluster co-chaperone protein HscB, mitochondrial [Rhizoctonia solani]QRW19013.1 iron-sulfur cluster co-chaperone protein HscB, mitochondrial [Rhizoctonia solani]
MSLLRLRSLVRPRGVVSLTSYRLYSALPTTCPSCNRPLPTRLPICPACSHIAPLPSSTNYYSLFDLPENTYKVDTKDLRNRFLKTQRLTHPDAWSAKPEKDKAAAANYSSFVNKGAEYLLSLRGVEMGETDSLEDQHFIIEIMDSRENVEVAETRDDLESLLEDNNAQVQDEINTISNAFDRGYLQTAKEASIRLKYRLGVQDSINARLHNM